MIGQSGLPMMNKLAGTKENAPDEVQAKTTSSGAGANASVSLPDAKSFSDALDATSTAAEQDKPLGTTQTSSASDVKSANATIDTAQAGLPRPLISTPMPLTDHNASITPEVAQQKSKLNAAALEAVVGDLDTQSDTKASSEALSIAQAGDLRGRRANRDGILETPSDPLARIQDHKIGISHEGQRSLSNLSDVESTEDKNGLFGSIKETGKQPEHFSPLTDTSRNEAVIRSVSIEYEENKSIYSQISPDLQATATEAGTQSLALREHVDGSRVDRKTIIPPSASLQNASSDPNIPAQNLVTTNADHASQKPVGPENSHKLAANQPSEISGHIAPSQVKTDQAVSELRHSSSGAGTSTQVLQNSASPTMAIQNLGDLRSANSLTETSSPADQLASSPTKPSAPSLLQSLNDVGSAASMSSVAAASNPTTASQINSSTPAPMQVLGNPRPSTSWGEASSRLELIATPPTPYSTPPEGSQTNVVLPSTTPQIQAIATDTSFTALNALSDALEVSLGPSSTATLAAQTRLDASIAPMPTPVSVDARLIAQQINQAIIRMDGTRTEVMLDPIELGRVSLTFVTKDDGVSVQINADRPETADLLRRNSEQLQRDLSGAGYEDVVLDFDQGDDAPSGQSNAKRIQEASSAQSLSVSYTADFATSGLDIRI